MEMTRISLDTSLGRIKGLETEKCRVFLGVPFAKAERFGYAQLTDRWEGEIDATKTGNACPQNRAWHPHLEHPVRRFYHREFREDLEFTYDEECLNLNIYAPKDVKDAPVIVFFYGGGFDSGINCEKPFEGYAMAERGVITVFANYRVGVLGYLTHEKVKEKWGRDGNFGLDDQRKAILWVKNHIKDFGGDPDNITLMGQSAGAISIQYLLLDPNNKGLFRHVIMMSGAGRWPKFSLPKFAEKTRGYWKQFMELAGCSSLDELKRASLDTLFDATEKIKTVRKDNVYNTMPVVDGVLLKDEVGKLIDHPLDVDVMLGYTNNDLYAPMLAFAGNRYARRHHGYVYFFDIDSPGDENGAFHSCDLYYVFGTMDKNWRPYGERDREVSFELMNSIANFARTGDPNGEGAPYWPKPGRGVRTKVLRIAPEGRGTGHTPYLRLLNNFLKKGEPKA